MKTYYTYLWLRENGTPYYAGKGIDRRAFVKHSHICPPPQDRRRIIVQEFQDEHDAFAAEVFLISFYGREDIGTGCLLNLSDGGEGQSGYRHSEETKQKIGKASAQKRRPLSEEWKNKIRAAKTGKKLGPQTPEHVSKRIVSHIGAKRSAEARRNMREGRVAARKLQAA
jgi:hypothetical protein